MLHRIYYRNNSNLVHIQLMSMHNQDVHVKNGRGYNAQYSTEL